ncbi:MAG TPA: hypothetical protein PKC18_11450 [Lacipirellulaceae bacterium]|nr:hypothetical protein [Lacipirellulaceae bacterium]
MRTFLDANVVFSACHAGSGIARLVALLTERHAAVTSDFALEEARRNVTLKRPSWRLDFDALTPRLEVVPSVVFELPVALDEKDRPILCSAIRAGCTYLITGDKTHFDPLYDTTVEGVQIVSLATMARLVASAP